MRRTGFRRQTRRKMSGFKDLVARDHRSIFLNTKELAGEHDLNGTTCTAIVVGKTSKGTFLSGADYDSFDGLYGSEVIVRCCAEDLPEIPVNGQRFDLDGEIYLVDSCRNDMGMLRIVLHGEMR